MKVLLFVVQLVVTIGLTFAVQLADKRRNLSEAQRALAWNTASWGAALYAFGPLSLVAWFWVTRRGWRRVVYSLPWLAVVVAIATGIDQLLRFALGLPR